MKRFLVCASIILVGAVIQALLVVGDPIPTQSWAFSLRVVASASVLILLVWSTFGIVDDNRLTLRLLLVTIVAVFCGILAGILNPVLALVVAVISLPVLAAAAAGPVHAVTRTIKAAPVRVFLGLAWAAVLLIVNAAVALVLGFFVTGPAAAGLTWLAFGISAAVLAIYWASLHRRAQSS
ncbi:hypothetical protein [Rhodococcoides yunnanense]|uniref:hypothetical protein n=1 Tax=Rhodococcoides yunnanense TaxID=278209 RepID=UPI000932C35A|nr:hypothetical protein [Rhodococcus yunnanensis]